MCTLRLAFLLTLVGVGCSLAQAVTPEKQAKVEELLRVTKMDALLQQQLDMVGKQMNTAAAQQVGKGNMNADQQKRFNEFEAKVQSIVAGALSWDKIRPIYIKLYSENFTDSELDGVIAFYKSPSGKAFVEKSPQLMTQAMHELQPQMQQMQRQLQQVIAEMAQDAKPSQGAKP